MNKFATAVTLLLAVAGFSHAAMASATDWEGPYVGVYAGPNHQQGHATTTTVFSPVGYFAASSVPAIAASGAQKVDTSGENIGVLAGYNFAFDENWVLGIEADFGINHDTSDTFGGNAYPCCSPTAFTVESKVQTNWLFTARPRVGYVWDNWMAYATGGLAMTNEKASFLFTDTFATAHESGVFTNTKVAWTVGGGIETMLSSDVTARIEYLYADFGGAGGTSTNLTAFSPAIAFPVNTFTHHASLTEHMVRFGLTLHV